MKKIIIPFLMAVALALPGARAQDVDTAFLLPNYLHPSLSVGLVGGMANNTLVVSTAYATDYHYDARKGFAVGFSGRLTLVDFPNRGNSFLLPDLSLRADLLLVQKNYKFSRNYSNPHGSDLSMVYTVHTNNYLDLPVMAELRWGRTFHLTLEGGFYVGGWLSAHRQGETFSLDDLGYGDHSYSYFDEPMEFSAERDNRLDAGWVYGLGTGISMGRFDLMVGARWYYGLTDIQKSYMLYLNPRYNTTMTLQGGISVKL